MAYTTIDDPSAHFHTQLYASNSGYEVSVVNDANAGAFKPDLIWVKSRADIGGYEISHNLIDSSRGVTKTLFSDTQGAESTASQSNYDLQSFDTDGFTTGAPESTNSLGGGAGTAKVAWQWKANGGTTTSVSASGTGEDSINASTHQVNTTAGFSIITYTGRDDQISNGQETKLTHGLGVKPDMFICKRRDGTSNWYVLGGNATETDEYWGWSYNEYLALNQSGAVNGVNYTGNKQQDSTYIYLGNALVNTVDSWIGYAFAEKQGFSKFGKFVGNGQADGPFVHTGFKPAFVMIKIIDTHGGTSEPWVMLDNKRSPFNRANKKLSSNSNDAENGHSAVGGAGYNDIDMLSNGFKIRTNNGATNTNAKLFGYTAFAENPFVTSTGVPTTAR